MKLFARILASVRRRFAKWIARATKREHSTANIEHSTFSEGKTARSAVVEPATVRLRADSQLAPLSEPQKDLIQNEKTPDAKPRSEEPPAAERLTPLEPNEQSSVRTPEKEPPAMGRASSSPHATSSALDDHSAIYRRNTIVPASSETHGRDAAAPEREQVARLPGVVPQLSQTISEQAREYITRQELKRELELLRRLMESKK